MKWMKDTSFVYCLQKFKTTCVLLVVFTTRRIKRYLQIIFAHTFHMVNIKDGNIILSIIKMVVADSYLFLIHHAFVRGKTYEAKPSKKRSTSAPNTIISECLKELQNYNQILFLHLPLGENRTNILIFHFWMNLHFGPSNLNLAIFTKIKLPYIMLLKFPYVISFYLEDISYYVST